MNIVHITVKIPPITVPKIWEAFDEYAGLAHRMSLLAYGSDRFNVIKAPTKLFIVGEDFNRIKHAVLSAIDMVGTDKFIVDSMPEIRLDDRPRLFHPARMLEVHQRFVNEWEPTPRYSKDSPCRDPHGPCSCGRRKRYRNCCGRGRK